MQPLYSWVVNEKKWRHWSRQRCVHKYAEIYLWRQKTGDNPNVSQWMDRWTTEWNTAHQEKRNELLTLRYNTDQSANNRTKWNMPAGGVGRTHITGFIYIYPEGAKQMAGTERSLAAAARRHRKCKKEGLPGARADLGGMDPLISWMLLVISRVYTNIETYEPV